MSKNKTTDAVYTVSQVASLCGVSRSTLLRLQDEELLIPSVQVARGDRRLYSFLDLMKLCQIKTFHDCGFTYSTIKDFFEDNGNYTNFISLLAARQNQLFHFMNEMQVRMADVTQLEIEYVYSPEIVCHTQKRFQRFPYYNLHGEIVHDQIDAISKKKYVLLTDRPLFLTTAWEDLAAGAPFDAEREFIAHTPLNVAADDASILDDPDVVVCHRMRMLSMLIRGPHLPMPEIIDKIKAEITEHDLTVTGPLYLVSLVGPHLGQDIPPDRYMARVMLPVE